MSTATIPTPRERLFSVLNADETPLAPVIWLLFPYHPLGCYADVRQTPSYQPVLDAAATTTITLNRRHMSVPLFTEDVTITHETLTDGAETVHRQTLSYKGRSLQAETRRGPQGARVEKLLRDEDDLAFYLSLPINLDKDAIHAALEPQARNIQAEAEAFPQNAGAMMLDLGEPINPLYANADLEEYAIWSLTHGDAITEWLNRHMEQKQTVYRYCLERNLAEVYFLVGSELASPPLVSRTTFQRWIVPYARELIDIIHNHGQYAIQHYHGQIKQILPNFLEMNPDALHTIEAPPVGNCTMTEAFEIVSDRIALIGNIQYDCFRAYTPEQMRAAVHALLDECRGKRFILSPTAGPYEQEITPQMADNYIAFIAAAHEHAAALPS